MSVPQSNHENVSNLMALEERKHEKLQSSSIITPNDIVCGRGKVAFTHAGNRKFRQSIEGSLEKYISAADKDERALVIQAVLDEIRVSGGSFKRKDFHRNRWVELSAPQCREKVGHALRDTAKHVCKKRLSLPKETSNLSEESSVQNSACFNHEGGLVDVAGEAQLETQPLPWSMYEDFNLDKRKPDPRIKNLNELLCDPFSSLNTEKVESSTFENVYHFGNSGAGSSNETTRDCENYDPFITAIDAALAPVTKNNSPNLFDTLCASMSSLQMSMSDLNYDPKQTQERDAAMEPLSSSFMSLCMSIDSQGSPICAFD